MRVYRAEAVIAAPIERVWAVLTDFDAYPAWNPFTVEVRTTRALGSPVDMRVDLGWAGLRWQRETLLALEPYRLVWGITAPPRALLWARREQTLEAVAGGTLYRSADTIGGAIEPLVRALFGAVVQRGFDRMAPALRLRAEQA
ncbi:MAG TPA: SRPBCC domain-containing protein [Myxococcota bacterium]|nr:SRPBCC domain-containing protein [Myxococcota bacterium]